MASPIDPYKLIEHFGMGLMRGAMSASPQGAVETPKAPRKPKAQAQGPQAPVQQAFQLDAPIAWGNGRSPFEPQDDHHTIAGLDDLFGTNARTAEEDDTQRHIFAEDEATTPLSQAVEIEQAAKQFGLHRMPAGDPPNTYRPGEQEIPPWMQPPIPTPQ